MAQKLQQQLLELGSKLESPPSAKDVLVKLLKQSATCLSELEQSPPVSVLESLQPFLNAIVKPEMLKHQDRDVKLLVATCVCEITRITAPEAPYNDEVLKDIFRLIVGTFSGLGDASGPSFGRRVVILETLARYRSCVVMLDLDCDDLVKEMFRTFFGVVRGDHSESVRTSMQSIMAVLLEESEDIKDDLLIIILSMLGRNKTNITAAARKLAMNVIEQCAGDLEPGIKQYLISSISGESRTQNNLPEYHEVVYDIYQCAPQILSGVVPYLTGELLTDQLETRLKAVKLVGDLFALPGCAISEAFQPIFSEFLKRLTDRVVGIRISVLDHVKSCLLSNPARSEAPQIISALCDRLLDYDENVRKQVVAVVCDVACSALTSIPVETVQLVTERLRDKSLLVKKYTMERLAEIFKFYCMRCSDSSIDSRDFDWIPGKILRCFYDKDFRSDTIEYILCMSLFPTDLSMKDKVKHWVRVFSGFDVVEIKALEKILEQKQRLQQEMQRYLSLRQMCQMQDGDGPEIQKKTLFGFRVMSRLFTDTAKTEENYQILDQLKDVNIWKILTSLLDPNTNFHQALNGRDDLLRILGEKHRLFDFLGTLTVKCSYLLFNKEYVKELLLEAEVQKCAGNAQYTLSSMNMLAILANFSPLLLSGVEEQLIKFLKDDNEIVKEGVLKVLAKCGGTIREQFAVLSSSVDLILERLCLEGSRRQAKYAVHALAAITKDDGLKSLSVLYKRLVDMLVEKTHLPNVLQSLGCIAETAMPVFETRESEIQEHIKIEILNCSNKVVDNKKASWDDRSELCLLKIYGIKTLVKSYLPVKDAHLRPAIDDLMGILRNILSMGEISTAVESSSVDKAHLRLASAKAVLRLARHWDQKIPIDVFHMTLRTSEFSFPHAKKVLLNKVHQYIKDRLLDAKYACAFLFNIHGSKRPEFEEDKHSLADIIQMLHQAKARQYSTQSDANSLTTYPEYILPYFIHAVAHHSCPNVDECKDIQAFEPIYRQLHIFISMLVHCDEDGKSEVDAVKAKESISTVISILQNIKCSEDVVDAAKSKSSHAICDLGLAIVKRIAQNVDDVKESTASVPLPPMLYKQLEIREGDAMASEGRTWLADEGISTHFEAFKLEADGTDDAQSSEDELLKDSDIDGNEVPLGKIIKHLKKKGTKGRKVAKNSFPNKKKDAVNDVDVLQMVREINLDNLGMSSKFESSNGNEKISVGKLKADLKHQNGNKRKSNSVAEVPVPKRRRSTSAHNAFKSPKKTSKVPLGSLKDNSHPSYSHQTDADIHSGSEDRMSGQKNVGEITDSDLLVSCLRKNSSSSKRKSEDSKRGHDDEEDEPRDAYDLKKQDMLLTSSKKRKRRSIAGLAKCTQKVEIEDSDMIGCRIRIWWPMDKRFYEGTIKSYDPIKGKHVILYEDCDVEVLRLDKERWELVNTSRKPVKKMSSLKSPPTLASSLQKNKMSGSQRVRKLTKTVKGKRTPKKKLDGKKGVSGSSFHEVNSRESSDMSIPEPALTSKVEDTNSGDSELQKAGVEVESLTHREDVHRKEGKSMSREKMEGLEENPTPTGHSDEEKQDIDSDFRKMESITQDGANTHDEEEKSYNSQENQTETLSEASGEEAVKVEQSDSEGNEVTDNVGSDPTDMKKSSLNPDGRDAENSDDELLSVWKRRAAKTGSRL